VYSSYKPENGIHSPVLLAISDGTDGAEASPEVTGINVTITKNEAYFSYENQEY